MIMTNKTFYLNTTTTMNNVSTRKPFFIQGQEILHNSFSQFDRGTLTRALVVLVCLTAFVLTLIGMKTWILRKRRQRRRYKLLSHATRMEEPLFNANDDVDDEEKEDDTLFVRK